MLRGLVRRQFILNGAVAIVCVICAAFKPVAAQAQQTKIATIGVLLTGAVNPDPKEFLEGLRGGLAQLDLIEGRNIKLEVRSAEGSAALLPEKAADLVGLKVDLIVAHLTPAAQAAKQATKDIPIVMAGVGDALGTGLVASLARPGGNVTGTSTSAAEVAGKTVELIHEVLPSVTRVAVLANETDPFMKPYLAQIDGAGRRLGLQIDPYVIRPSTPQAPVFDTMREKQAGALIIQGSISRKGTLELAIQNRLPSFGSSQAWPKAGGLMSYSANQQDVFRQVAEYVDKILKGRKPADLPVALPTKFDLVVNLKAAKAIGVTIPESFLTRADEVIE
ncbi:ABC transporter substrate-binding protein [Rhodoplanes sp. Z2-YC6860]|uniref:ABC transporter substrate-binding protein n=1 Tax=Rhodoplanes sp. Z2-YC6860 TaxID=674703 RepID=UPI00078CB02C|nr:ABC transporter substrate-binding protein [Rhodoplanes sp. Z2-YC6860]AMN44195.1 ABC transporter substrate binding protein [Rhodoplanes sp. Z2-YC6860]